LEALKGEQGESIKGDKGDKGDKGEQGIQGLQGQIGLTGAKGDKGDTGDTGPIGPQGEQGIQGPQGSIGPMGLQGPQGIRGVDGAQGPQGDTGPQGPQGPVGLQGPQGDTGDQGPKGDKGDQGIQGVKGDKGDQGDPGTNGVDGQDGEDGVSIQGPQGEPGTSSWVDGFQMVSTTGSIQIGNVNADGTDECNDNNAGIIRFNNDNGTFEGCNGTSWVTFDVTVIPTDQPDPPTTEVIYTTDFSTSSGWSIEGTASIGCPPFDHCGQNPSLPSFDGDNCFASMCVGSWTNSNRIISRTITLPTSGNIRISFWMRNVYYIAGRGTGPVEMRLDGFTFDSRSISGLFDWELHSIDINEVSAGNHTLSFVAASHFDAGLMIDELKVLYR